MATSSAFRGLGSKCMSVMAAASKSFSSASSTSAASPKPKIPTKKSSLPPNSATSASASASSPSSSSHRGVFSKSVPVSPQLGQFLGAQEASRTFAVKKVWEYIKNRGLQDPTNKRVIHTDEKLRTIFDGKAKVDFLEIARLLSQHFVKT